MKIMGVLYLAGRRWLIILTLLLLPATPAAAFSGDWLQQQTAAVGETLSGVLCPYTPEWLLPTGWCPRVVEERSTADPIPAENNPDMAEPPVYTTLPVSGEPPPRVRGTSTANVPPAPTTPPTLTYSTQNITRAEFERRLAALTATFPQESTRPLIPAQYTTALLGQLEALADTLAKRASRKESADAPLTAAVRERIAGQAAAIFESTSDSRGTLKQTLTDEGTFTGATLTRPALTSARFPQLSIGQLLYLTATGTLTAASDLSVTDSALRLGTTTTREQLTLASPIYLGNSTPPGSTQNRLYADGGSLYWNGSIVTSSSTANWSGDGAGNVYRLTGRVGIGTDNPETQLDLRGTQSLTGNLYIGTTTGDQRSDIKVVSGYREAAMTLYGTSPSTAEQSFQSVIDFRSLSEYNNSFFSGPVWKIGQRTKYGTANADFGIVFIDQNGNANTSLAAKRDGTLGVGTSQPNSKLTVLNTDTEDSFRVNDEANDSSPFVIDADGTVGIGTTSPTSKLTVSGSGFFGGTITATGTLNVQGSGTSSIAGDLDLDGALRLNDESFTDLTGAGLTNVAGALRVATSSLGLGDGTFQGLSDTPGSYTADRIPYMTASGLSASENLVFDGQKLEVGGNSSYSSLSEYVTVRNAERAVGVRSLTETIRLTDETNPYFGVFPYSADTSFNHIELNNDGDPATEYSGQISFSTINSNFTVGKVFGSISTANMQGPGSVTDLIGSRSRARMLSGLASTSIGSKLISHNTSGNFVGDAYGAYASSYVDDASTVGTSTGVFADSYVDTNGLITNSYGVRIGSNQVGGAAPSDIQNAYGLYIADQSNAQNSYALYSADGTSPSFLAGDVGIGTTSPSSKLDVWGDFRVGTSGTPLAAFDPASNTATFGTSASGNASRRTTLTMNNTTQEFVPSDPQIVGGVKDAALLDGARSVTMSGRYAYVVNYNDDSLRIIDVSDHTNPTIVGGVKDASLLNGAHSVTVAGRYAYVANYLDSSLRIVDVSDPTDPSIVGGVRENSLLGGASSVTVVGRYAYVTNVFDDSLRIIDVSNPTNPSIVGGVKDASLLDFAISVTVAGRYAYVANFNDDSLRVIDVSDPNNPTIVGGVKDASLLNGALSITVSGRYVYVASAIDDSLRIIDVSDPTSPTIVGGVDDATLLNNARFVTVAGRYAYVTNRSDDSLRIIDISDPTSPTIVGGVKDASLLEGANSVTVAGRHAYVANLSDDSLRVIDLGGIDTPTGNIGSLLTSTLDTERATVNQFLTVAGGLNVGTDALIDGSLTVAGAASSTLLTDTTNPSLLVGGGTLAFGTTSTSTTRLTIQSNGTNDVLNLLETGGDEVFTVLENGNVGVGTTSPTSTLDVWGDFRVGTSSTPSLFVDSSTGNVGIGTNGPNNALTIRSTLDDTGPGFSHFSETNSTNRARGNDLVFTSNVGGFFRAQDVDDHEAVTVAAIGGSNLPDSVRLVGKSTVVGIGRAFDAGSDDISTVIGSKYLIQGLRISSGAGTSFIDNAYGIYMDTPEVSASGGGTAEITNATGLAIDEFASAIANNSTELLLGTTDIPTGDYALYSNSDLNSYFAGNVGIGAESPNAKLGVKAKASDTQLLTISGSNDAWRARFDLQSAGTGAAILRMRNGIGSEEVNISTDGDSYILGNVGIGTTNPQGNLEVSDTSGTQLDIVSDSNNTNSSSDGIIRFWTNGNQTGGDRVGTVGYDNSNDVLTLSHGTVSGNHMNIDSSGNIGIGTTSPASKLDINGDVTIRGDIYDDHGDQWQIAQSDIRFFDKHVTAGFGVGVRGNRGDNLGIDRSSFNGNHLGLYAGSNEVMSLGDNGNVGIGTTSPSSKLDVWGDFRVGTSSTPSLFVDASTGNVGIGTNGPNSTLNVTSELTSNNNLGSYFSFYTSDINERIRGQSVFLTSGDGSSVTLGGQDQQTAQTINAVARDTGRTSTMELLGQRIIVGIGNFGSGSDAIETIVGSDYNLQSARLLSGSGSSVVSTAYGVRIGTPQIVVAGGTAEITNATGLAIGEFASAVANNSTELLLGTTEIPTGDYALYSNSDLNSYFAGNVGIGTTTPTSKLTVAGVITPESDNTHSLGNSTYRWSEVYAANGTINTSDIRLKENIAGLEYGLEEVLQLDPITFTWRDNPQQGEKFGLVAQDVQDLIPEVVHVGDDPDQTLGIRYTELIAVVINAIKELWQSDEELREENQRLKERLRVVEEELDIDVPTEDTPAGDDTTDPESESEVEPDASREDETDTSDDTDQNDHHEASATSTESASTTASSSEGTLADNPDETASSSSDTPETVTASALNEYAQTVATNSAPRASSTESEQTDDLDRTEANEDISETDVSEEEPEIQTNETNATDRPDNTNKQSGTEYEPTPTGGEADGPSVDLDSKTDASSEGKTKAEEENTVVESQ